MKKLLTSLLCVMMVVCFMPSMAWADAGDTASSTPKTIEVTAEKDLNTALNEATAGDTIKLTVNVTVAAQITINKGIILDGDGKTITVTHETTGGTGSAGILVTEDNVTIQNVKVVGPNTSGAEDSAQWAWKEGQYVIKVYSADNVTISDVDLSCGSGAIQVNSASVTIAGKINMHDNMYDGIEVTTGSNLTNKGTLTVDDTATFTNEESRIWMDSKDKGTVTSSGQIAQTVNPDKANEYLYLTKEPAVQVGDNYYLTLNDAIHYAGDNESKELVLLKDIKSASKITLPEGVTLDGNGNTITATEKITSGGFIETTNDNVTIKNITINTAGNASHGVQFYCANGGKLENVTVNGGSFTSVIVNGAQVAIENCTLNPEKDAYANIEYAMGNGVNTIPAITVDNVIASPELPLVYVDQATINAVVTNTEGLTADPEISAIVAEINKTLTGTQIRVEVDEDGNATLTPSNFTISFDPNGGTVTPQNAVTNEEGKLAELPTPTYSGYTFKGWFTALTGGEEVKKDTQFSKATTIYARWTSNSGYVPTTPTVQKPVIEPNADVTTTLSSDGTTLTIKANDGYEVTDVTVNGVSKGAVDKVTGLKTGDKVVIKTQKTEKPDDNAALIDAVKNTKLIARTAMSKAKGKKAVKVYWYAEDGSDIDFDGYEVYRSLKRYSGFGKAPIFKTANEKYYNTAIKKGAKYYYKVRAYKVINGEKVYTDWSTKAWRTVK